MFYIWTKITEVPNEDEINDLKNFLKEVSTWKGWTLERSSNFDELFHSKSSKDEQTCDLSNDEKDWITTQNGATGTPYK